jgi:hypothetical protein
MGGTLQLRTPHSHCAPASIGLEGSFGLDAVRDGISLGISRDVKRFQECYPQTLQTTSAESIQADFKNISRIYPQFHETAIYPRYYKLV